MHWLRSHPFALMFAGAGLVFLFIFALINGSRAPLSSFNPQVVSVSGGSAPQGQQDPGISPLYTYNTPSQTPAESNPSAPTATDAPPQTQSTPASSAPVILKGQSVAQALADEVPQPASTPAQSQTKAQTTAGADTSATDALIQSIYATIPLSVSPLNTPITRTSSQSALYIYGNQAGLAVLSFENAHSNMATDLKAWTDNRSSTSAQSGVRQIAADMNTAGDALLNLANVPPAAAAANQALGTAYKNAAAALLSVVNTTGGDTAVADSMKSYDTVADNFTKSYVALADLFTESSVTFSSSDTGSVFSFSE